MTTLHGTVSCYIPTLLNSQDLPSRKVKLKKKQLKVINFYGNLSAKDVAEIEALVDGKHFIQTAYDDPTQ